MNGVETEYICYNESMIFYLKGYQHSLGDISEMLSLQSVIRIFAYSAVLVVLFVRLYYGLFSYNATPLIYLTMVVVAVSISMLLISHWNMYKSWQTFFIKTLPILDLVIISALVHLSSGIESRFSFLYILPCLSLIVFSIKDVIRMAFLSFASYTAVILFNHFNAREVVEYSSEQLSAIMILRMGLIISITIFTATLLILYVARLISRHIDKKDEAIFAAASTLSDPLEEAAVLLEQIKIGQVISTEVYSKITHLQSGIRDSLVEKNFIMEKAQTSAPMCKKVNLHLKLDCTMCNKRINLFGKFWSIPRGYKVAFNFGKHNNEIHCDACHTKNGSRCDYCESWR